jgi:hypothetical protein
MPPEGEDTLLRATQMDELRHRLRNHLQNMISLISLQIRRAQNEETIAALEDLRARFASITSIYIDLDDSSDHPIALEKVRARPRAPHRRPVRPGRRTWRDVQDDPADACRASARRSSARSWSSW